MGAIDRLIENKILPVILGPTASGKTAISLELAKYFDIEIISADSRQIYKYLDIGTAKPTVEEFHTVPHHFVDIIYPDAYYSAGLFADNAATVALDIFSKGKLPVVVGGSGLYIKALCDGLFQEEVLENKYEIRAGLEERLINEGIESLYDELSKVDPASAGLYSDKNPRRIIRSLEYYYLTGSPLSKDWRKKQPETVFNPVYFALDYDRQILYDRINLRTEKMWTDGIVDETRKVLEMGYSPSLNSLNTVGYKETIAFLNNQLTKTEAVELIKQNTRRYAKRQLTWFRKNPEIHWISEKNETAILTINDLLMKINKGLF